MRHRLAGRKLNRKRAHRQAMLENLAVALIQHEQIKTTLPKAKELRRIIEPLISLGKRGGLSSWRRAHAITQDKKSVRKLFGVLAKRYRSRPGGYTRILKAGYRYGDHAPIAIMELVERDLTAKGQNSGQPSTT